VTADGPARARLHRTALRLAYATVAYNVFEAAVAIAAGVAAASPALISFGGDSIVECLSALVIVWQFRGRLPEEREHRALRGIAIAFFALAGYVTVDATRALLTGAEPEASPVGIALAALSLLVMPLLVRAKRRVAAALGSASVAADSVQSLLCTYLSAVLLIGLGLNALLGWWWADPVAALVVAGLAITEGREAWQESR
jgi:divalent metal cation (Fe/Co/Zn/Cd) transporter